MYAAANRGMRRSTPEMLMRSERSPVIGSMSRAPLLADRFSIDFRSWGLNGNAIEGRCLRSRLEERSPEEQQI